jgi:hypothetical protein
MADYKNIKGFNIQYLDSDPPNPIEGQMWFNSTTQTLKGAEVGGFPVGTWASAAGITTARAYLGCSGVQTAAIYMGTATPTYGGLTEIYNGTSWTEVGDLNTGRVYGFPSGFGTITATVVAGGEDAGGNKAETESWNGTSWTEVNDLNVAKHAGAGMGTSIASLAAGGNNPGGYTTSNESWDGTSWTEVGDLNTAKYINTGIGLQTAALSVGGQSTPSPTLAQVESWNGTSWTETTDINTARFSMGGAGIQTSALVYGGSPGSYNITEFWNGTAWTELNDLATGRSLLSQQQGMSSTATLAVNPSTASEEWTVPEYVVKTFTTS